ncbi:MAG: hypothetical protein M1834_002258 [Cirrosporium novae-zelandiae]|nr:MAG: hypothetical protein M1834_002258 [Cirrosporium novae-zelandiae]
MTIILFLQLPGQVPSTHGYGFSASDPRQNYTKANSITQFEKMLRWLQEHDEEVRKIACNNVTFHDICLTPAARCVLLAKIHFWVT